MHASTFSPGYRGGHAWNPALSCHLLMVNGKETDDLFHF